MALVECSECNWQISDTAYFCPKCGFVRRKLYLENPAKNYYIFSLLSGILGGLFWFLYFTQKVSSDTKDLYITIAIICVFIMPVSVIIGWIMSCLEVKSK